MGINITGKTGLLAVLGTPIQHSLSPAMHNLALQTLGLDYTYLAFDIKEEQVGQALEGLKLFGFRGCNLTMPLKKKALEYCDHLSESARISGAVNTIINDHGILTGDTTDGTGVLWAMRANGHEMLGKKVTIMGAGGASVSIVTQGALDGVKEITVFNRKGESFSMMEQVAEELNQITNCNVKVLTLEDEDRLRREIKESQFLINGTSLGMAPHEDTCILPDSSYFHRDLVVADVVYDPRETKFMKFAKEAGAIAYNGLDMLLYQGAKSFELWMGVPMPVEIVKEKVFDPERKK